MGAATRLRITQRPFFTGFDFLEDIKRKGQQRAATKEAKEAAKATAPKKQKTGPDPN